MAAAARQIQERRKEPLEQMSAVALPEVDPGLFPDGGLSIDALNSTLVRAAGDSIPEEEGKELVRLLEHYVERGAAIGAFNLAQMYTKGYIVDRDKVKGHQLFITAAKLAYRAGGDEIKKVLRLPFDLESDQYENDFIANQDEILSRSMHALSENYREGKGTPINPSLSWKCASISKHLGLEGGIAQVARALSEGFGTKKDPAEALLMAQINYVGMSQLGGTAQTSFMMGDFLRRGVGGQPDRKSALTSIADAFQLWAKSGLHRSVPKAMRHFAENCDDASFLLELTDEVQRRVGAFNMLKATRHNQPWASAFLSFKPTFLYQAHLKGNLQASVAFVNSALQTRAYLKYLNSDESEWPFYPLAYEDLLAIIEPAQAAETAGADAARFLLEWHEKEFTDELHEHAKQLKRSAERGDVASMSRYAWYLHVFGPGGDEEGEQVFFWATKADRAGDAFGTALLGAAHIAGQGTKANVRKGRRLVGKAFKQGFIDEPTVYFMPIAYDATDSGLTRQLGEWVMFGSDLGEPACAAFSARMIIHELENAKHSDDDIKGAKALIADNWHRAKVRPFPVSIPEQFEIDMVELAKHFGEEFTPASQKILEFPVFKTEKPAPNDGSSGKNLDFSRQSEHSERHTDVMADDIGATADLRAAPNTGVATLSPAASPAISTDVPIDAHFVAATDATDFGAMLKALREEQEISVSEMARRLDCQRARIREIENKGADLRAGTIMSYLHALDKPAQLGLLPKPPANRR